VSIVPLICVQVSLIGAQVLPAAGEQATATPSTNACAVELRLEGSLSQRTGNTDKLAYSYGLNLAVERSRHTVTGGIRGEWSKNKGQAADVDNLRADLTESWRWSGAVEPYAKITYYRNEIWGFRHQVRAGVGLVQGWWATSSGPAFRTRIGYQFRASEFTALWERAEGAKPEERQHCVLMGFRTRIPVMEHIALALTGDFEPVLSEGDNYYADLNGSLTFVVNERVNLIASQDLTYQRIPVPGKKQRNTESSIRLSVRV
jgi:hypothetical protein